MGTQNQNKKFGDLNKKVFLKSYVNKTGLQNNKMEEEGLITKTTTQKPFYQKLQLISADVLKAALIITIADRSRT